MPITFTRRGRYRLSRENAEISQHNVAEEAYENAIEHAETNGSGTYRVDPPWIEVAVPIMNIARGGTAMPPGPNPPPPDPPSGDPLFFDDFDYAVGRDDSGASKSAAFTTAGWTGLKDETTNSGQARGYFSTATSIPGFGGSIPGATGRMLRLECLAGTMSGQTDFYLQFGSGTAGNIPANLWAQHWIYVNRSGSELSSFAPIGGKWLYPLFGSNSGYPMATTDTCWLNGIYYARNQAGSLLFPPTTGAMTFGTSSQPAAGAQERAYMTDQAGSGAQHLMTPRDLATENDHWLFPNTWYLVKFNFDVAQNPGSHRIWWREYGQHVAGFGNPKSDWREGVTSGFTYDTYASDWLGAKRLRIPTTIGTSGGAGADFFIYLADFALATSEANLPTYGSY